MKILDSTPDRFRAFIKGRKILCFGGGDYFRLFVYDFGGDAEIAGVIDNDISKRGERITAGQLSATVLTPDEALCMAGFSDMVLVITASAYREIISQLEKIRGFDTVTCFVYAQIKYSVLQPAVLLPKTGGAARIPPVIHYCWFGGNPLPENLRRCVDSWRRLCPGYEIIQWNEKNYHCRKNAWTAKAYDEGRWAYLADYARIDIIAAHGGIYLDTDVELLQNPDPLRHYKGFVATEAHGGVNLGSGFGAAAGLNVFQELLADFQCEFEHGVTFRYNVGRETEVLWRHGYKLDGTFQVVRDVAVLPFNVFTPVIADTREPYITSATVGVHYFNRGWKKE